jgi:NAD(P) transhydrogenase subunit alpha
MKFFIPKETHPGEKRIAMIPPDVGKLVKAGAEVAIESGMGTPSRHEDAAYEEAGASVATDRTAALEAADVVLRLRPPARDEVSRLKSGSLHISHLDPFNGRELVEALAAQGVNALSVEMIPRTTIAQKMDALSSQANLAGYVTVMLAAERLDKAMPMMMTPAGTLSPARVFVIGAGVAGLQAIATARRLGARVDAFDVRPEAADQIESLGAKAVKIDIGETGSTKDGYAKQLTDEQLEKQKQGMAKICAHSDVVITTAQVFGRKSPLIVSTEMVKGMQPGSVVVDMAVEGGGNVECSELDKEVDVDGVTVIGLANLPGRVPIHASQMYSSNLTNLVTHFWDEESKAIKLDTEDEILARALVTYNGEIFSEMIKNAYADKETSS